MEWGGPFFVLAIIFMAMSAGVAKSWIRAKHGLPEREGRRRHHKPSQLTQETPGEVLQLRSENQRLTERLSASEDRLAVLERIVTDRGYGLAEEIEALRGKPVRNTQDNGVPLTFRDKEEA